MDKAVLNGLMVTTVVTISLKWLTGIALLPLALVAIIVFAFALGLALRLDRASTGRR